MALPSFLGEVARGSGAPTSSTTSAPIYFSAPVSAGTYIAVGIGLAYAANNSLYPGACLVSDSKGNSYTLADSSGVNLWLSRTSAALTTSDYLTLSFVNWRDLTTPEDGSTFTLVAIAFQDVDQGLGTTASFTINNEAGWGSTPRETQNGSPQQEDTLNPGNAVGGVVVTRSNAEYGTNFNSGFPSNDSDTTPSSVTYAAGGAGFSWTAITPENYEANGLGSYLSIAYAITPSASYDWGNDAGNPGEVLTYPVWGGSFLTSSDGKWDTDNDAAWWGPVATIYLWQRF